MKLSIWPSFQRPWSEILDAARWAEARGFHGLWFADHYMPDTADGSPSDDPGLECWSSIAALAGLTSRLRLGSLVSPSTVHHPAVLAKQVATIDHVSDGRIVLGIGAGWQVNEHRAFGIDLPAAGPRVSRFEEFVQIVSALLHDGRCTFEGHSFTITDAPCEPRPIQDRLEIMVGTASDRMMKITARHADVWNVWGTPERVAERGARFGQLCDEVGRDPSRVRRTSQGLFFIEEDAAKAAIIRSKAQSDRATVGPFDLIVDTIRSYADVGVDELIIPDFSLGRDSSERRDRYERLADALL